MTKPLNNLQLSINSKDTPPSVLEFINELLAQSLDIRLPVSGKSMQPTLEDNDVVTLRMMDTSKLKQGDLVLYLDNWNQLVLHRLIRRFQDNDQINCVQTCGDALQIPDTPVQTKDIIAVVRYIEKSTGQTQDLTLISQRVRSRLTAQYLILKAVSYRLLTKLRPALIKT